MTFFSKIVNALKPHDYSVSINSGTTTKAAVRTVSADRFRRPAKVLASTFLALAILGGGASAAFASTAVSSTDAKADVLADALCINAEDGTKNGQWSDGANRFSKLGGTTIWTMQSITASTPADSVVDTFFNPDYDSSKPLTAYEKYGIMYPKYDGWKPGWTDDTFRFQGSTSNAPLGADNPSEEVKAGDGLMVTQDLFSCMAIPQAVESAVANALSTPPKLMLGISIQIYGSSYGQSISDEDSILYPLGTAIDGLITDDGGLRDTLFLPFLIPLVLIGAVYLGFVGIVKGQSTVALQGVAWMIAAVALGTFFLQQPTKISSFIDSGVSEVQIAVNSIVSGPTTTNDMCSVSGTGVSAADKARRGIQCTIWYASVYSPWVTGQFGTGINQLQADSGTGKSILTDDPRGILNNDDYKIEYGTNDVNADNWAQFMLDRQATGLAMQQSEVAYVQLSGASDTDGVNAVWAGGTGAQVLSSLLLWVSVPASSVVLLVFGVILLMYQLLMVSAVIMSPFFFLIGIVPNFGKAILLRYAELLIGLFVKRIITSLTLAIYFVFYMLLVSDVTVISLPIQIILVVVLSIFALVARGKFVNLFASQIDFGGNKSVGLPGTRAAATGAGILGAGAGLAAGGLLGAIIGGTMANKGTKSVVGDVAGSKDGIELQPAGSPVADVRPPTAAGGSTGASGQGGAGQENGPSVLDKAGKAVRAGKDIKEGAQMVGKLTEAASGGGAGPRPTLAFPSGASSAASSAATAAPSAAATVAPAAATAAAGTAGSAAATAAATSAASGVAAGAATGAAAGSVVPIAGTIAGAAVGAAAVAVGKKVSDKSGNAADKLGDGPSRR